MLFLAKAQRAQSFILINHSVLCVLGPDLSGRDIFNHFVKLCSFFSDFKLTK